MFARVHDVDQMFGTLNLFRHGMEDFFLGPYQGHKGAPVTSAPLTNIYDDGDAFLFQAELAGVSKDDLTIELQGKHLEIKGERKNNAPEGYTVHRQGRLSGYFSRSYTLPVAVDAEKVKTTLENGILTLTLPKAEEARKRQIMIQ
jgi:HSP20 family protein